MRIALVTDYYPPSLGGVQTAVKALKDSLSRAGHEATVFCPLRGGSTDPDVVALPVSRVIRPDGYPFAWSPRRISALLAAEFARRGIEVVHTHSEMFASLAGVRTARRLGLPVVHTMHGRVDVFTETVLPAPALTVPLLAVLHSAQLSHRGLPVSPDAPYTGSRTSRRMWRLMLAQARASGQVIVPSDHFARKLIEQGMRTPVTVLSNGLEPPVLERIGDPQVRTLGADETMRVIWAGRLSPEKRPEVFARAAASFGAGVSADIYGDGLARRSVDREVRSAGGGAAITVHGAVAQREVLDAMRSAHLLVSSSHGFDNQPMVMLEAVASGLPVLYADPDLAEVVPDGGGFLASAPDAAGIAETVRELRRHPERIAAASAGMVEARSRAAQQVEPVLAVYAAAMSSGAVSR